MAGTAKKIDSQIRQIAERVTSSEGMELVDVEYKGGSGRQIVRIYIDKANGISHADCELVSRQVGAIMDVEDIVPGRYVLEVSSPGLDRKLLKPADYQRFSGRKARITLREPVQGRRNFTGRLLGYEGQEILLELSEDNVIRISFEDVQHARLTVEF